MIELRSGESPRDVCPGEPVVLFVTVRDPEGDRVTGRATVRDGGRPYDSGPLQRRPGGDDLFSVLLHAPDAPGVYEILVEADDAHGEEAEPLHMELEVVPCEEEEVDDLALGTEVEPRRVCPGGSFTAEGFLVRFLEGGGARRSHPPGEAVFLGERQEVGPAHPMASLSAPGEPGEFPVEIHLRIDGREVRLSDRVEVVPCERAEDPAERVPAEPEGTPSDIPEPLSRLEGATPMVVGGSRFCAWGRFHGGAWEDLRLDGKELERPTEASRRLLWFRLAAGTRPGPHTLAPAPDSRFEESPGVEIRALRIGASLDRTRLMRGEATPFRLWVEGTREPVSVRIENRTPGIVSIEGGDVQVVTTGGGEDNAVERTVRAESPGDFDLRYDVQLDDCPEAPRPEVDG